MKIEIDISDSRVADLLCSALEGGCAWGWMLEFRAKTPAGAERAKPWGDNYTPAYIYAPFTDGGSLVVEYLNADSERGTRELDRAQLQQGLRVMVEKHPYQLARILAESDDAHTGDMFLQCCVFGEVVYA